MSHKRREKRSHKRCPKCRVICTNRIEDRDHKPLEKKSSFCIIEAPKSVRLAIGNEQELISRMWAFLEPPDVSGTIPLIKPERLEKVRRLITEPGLLPKRKIDTHFEEELYVKVHPDQSIMKIKSRTEIKLFHPSSSDENDDYCCPKPCDPPPECCKILISPCYPPQSRALPSCQLRPFTSTPNPNNQPNICKKICPNDNY